MEVSLCCCCSGIRPGLPIYYKINCYAYFFFNIQLVLFCCLFYDLHFYIYKNKTIVIIWCEIFLFNAYCIYLILLLFSIIKTFHIFNLPFYISKSFEHSCWSMVLFKEHSRFYQYPGQISVLEKNAGFLPIP